MITSMTFFSSLDLVIDWFSRIHSYFTTYKHIQRVAESATANIFSWKAWLAVPLAIPSLCPGSCREAGSVYTRSHSFPSVHFAYLSFHVIRAGRPLPSFGPPFAPASSRWPPVLGWGGSPFLMQVLLRRWPNPRCVFDGALDLQR